MNIFVCIKAIQNPELPTELFRIDEEAKEVIPVRDMSLVTSPFDNQAVEAALRIRDMLGDANIVAVSFGPNGSEAALKRALAMGVDTGILIPHSGPEEPDSFVVASLLVKAIEAAGEFDLILAGRQAADWDAGIVGCGMAELLAVPVVTLAKSVRAESDHFIVERVLEDGFETVQVPIPCVITVANELGEPRKASLRETMRANKKTINILQPADLGVTFDRSDERSHRRLRDRLYIPVKNGECVMFDGPSPQNIATELAMRLRQERLLQ